VGVSGSTWSRARWLLLAAGPLGAALAVGTCREPARREPQDLTAPVVGIVFPVQATGAYDRDSNGLVDVEVEWSDSSGKVDPATVRVVCAGCVPGVAADTNLAQGWRVVRLDSAGAVFEETIPLLMRAGQRLLGVSVADTAGNRSIGATVSFTLPPGDYHRTIDLQYPAQWPQERGVDLAITPDGRKGFAPFENGHVAVFDPDGVQPTHYITNVSNSIVGSFISIDSGTGLAYVAGGGWETAGFTVLDTRTEQVVRSVAVGMGAVSVWQSGSRVFAGEACTNGRVFVYDKATLAQLGRVEVGASSTGSVCPNTIVFALTRDGRLGWAGIVMGGIFSFDAVNYTLLRRYDLFPPEGDGVYNSVSSMVMAGDRWLYVAEDQLGLEEFDTGTGRATARYPSDPRAYALVKKLSLSPDGRLLFASTDPATAVGDHQSAPLLFTVPGLQIRHRFPTRPGIVDGVAFHPDGKRVFQMAGFAVQVYLVRPE